MSKMLATVKDMEQAVVAGDWYCQCGYRKSRHEDGSHPAIDPHTGKCNANGLKRSLAFNEALLLDTTDDVELFPGDEAAA